MRQLLWPLGLAAILLSPFLVQAQPAHRLTLDDALTLAVARSHTLAAARRQMEAADGALDQAGRRRNPELSATVEDTRRDARTTTATLDFPLELGGKRAARVAAAACAREVARAGFDQVRAELRAAVVGAYFGALVAQERASLAVDSAALAARGAAVVAQRVAAGKVSPVDATRARIDQVTAQLEADEAAAELQTARYALAASWGDDEPRFDAVAGDPEEVPDRGTPTALAQRLDDSPLLAVARGEVARRLALVEVERSKAAPDLTLSVGAKRDNELGRTQAIVGVSMPLPFFDRNQGAMQEAAQQAEQAREAQQATRVRLLAELQQASRQLAHARVASRTLQSTVLPAAREASDAAIRGFEAGKFGFIDVLDAQRALLQARARYLTTLSAAHQAAATLDRLLGR